MLQILLLLKERKKETNKHEFVSSSFGFKQLNVLTINSSFLFGRTLKMQKRNQNIAEKCKTFCLTHILFHFLYEHVTYYTRSENKHFPNLGCYTKQFEERDCCTRQPSITVVATNKIRFQRKGTL